MLWLWPLSWIFGLVVRLRNWLFDRGLLRSETHELPLICIGNLAVGGTGKTPHTELLAQLLLEKGKCVGILSRGYGRDTRGFHWVEAASTASQVGDEPLQMRLRLPHERLYCAVCENRNKGIRLMRKSQPQLDVILLDDAFQHRWVRPTLSIVLTDYTRPYHRDHLLPAGRLREPMCGARRAEIILVTRCPEQLSPIEGQALADQLCTHQGQSVFFTSVAYAPLPPLQRVLLITGIAHPEDLLQHLREENIEVEHLRYPDHHRFTISDAHTIIQRAAQHSHLLTTDKDAVRLAELDLPSEVKRKLHTVSITPQFLFQDYSRFLKTLQHYV